MVSNEGKIHRLLAIAGVAVCAMLFSFTTDQAIDKRVLSTYFGNIAFAYEDYGLPYCFMSSVFNTGIDEPNDYNEETIDQITNNGEMAENKTGRASDALPNIIVVQLESYFDVDEAEFSQQAKMHARICMRCTRIILLDISKFRL